MDEKRTAAAICKELDGYSKEEALAIAITVLAVTARERGYDYGKVAVAFLHTWENLAKKMAS